MNASAPYDEKLLLQQVANGDEQAFATLFHAWRDKLYFFFLKINNSPQFAEDLVQDIFVKLWLMRSDLNELENFSAWLYRISHNQAITGMRRMAMETLILGQMRKEAAISGTTTDDAILQKQLEQRLQQAINALPPQQKMVYTLARIEGLKQEEIAARMNISVSTVKNHMTAALNNLRTNLGRDYPVMAIYSLLWLALACAD